MNLPAPRDHALRLGVWAVVGTEAALFVGLIAARGHVRSVPSMSVMAFALAVGIALFGAGSALAQALRRLRDGQPVAAGRLLGLAGVVGVTALVLELGASRMYMTRDALGVVIIGLHAAHVSAAVALAAWVLALVRCGRIHRRQHDLLRLVSSYWYFVAGVWLFVWPLLATQP